MSRADRLFRRALDRAGLGLLVVFPGACVVAAFALWLTGN
jgi:hypothetical protein